jgi:DNA mismatch repair ATPase MutL
MAIASINPATGKLLKEFEPLSHAEIESKLERSASALREYRKLPFADRSRMMRKVADILEREKELLRPAASGPPGAAVSDYRAEPDEPPTCAFRLTGFFSRPQVQKGNRNSIFIFVNGRLIRDRLLLHALSSAGPKLPR